MWPEQHALRQFPMLLEEHYIMKLEKFGLFPEQLYDMDPEVCNSSTSSALHSPHQQPCCDPLHKPLLSDGCCRSEVSVEVSGIR